MTKSELIEKLVLDYPLISKKESELIITSVFDDIASALVSGDRVEIRGFGSFSVKDRGARLARNPKTGEQVDIGSKKVPFFKTGKELKERVDS